MFFINSVHKKKAPIQQQHQLAIILFLPVNDFRITSLFLFIIICMFARKIFPLWKEVIIAAFLSLIAILIPLLNFILLSLSSAIILLLTIPYVDKFIPNRAILAHKLWFFLDEIGFISYFYALYDKYFLQKKQHFYFHTLILYFFCILYFIISKYLLLNKNCVDNLSLSSFYLLFFSLVLSFLAFYIRFLLNLSILVKEISPLFYVPVEGLDPEQVPSSGHDSNKSTSRTTSSKSVVSFHSHSHHRSHNYTESLRATKNAVFFKRLGFCVGLCGLGVAGYAAYQQGLQTYHTARGADIAAVEAGLITKETYYQRHPQDRPTNTSKK